MDILGPLEETGEKSERTRNNDNFLCTTSESGSSRVLSLERPYCSLSILTPVKSYFLSVPVPTPGRLWDSN